MDIKVDKINLSVPTKIIKAKQIPIIFLHGFTQSSSDWKEIIKNFSSTFFPIAIDFIGHGKSESPKDHRYYTSKAICESINAIYRFFKIEKAIIVGYSMGGRAALTFADKYPEKVLGLILESTSPGLVDIEEREQRIESDTKIIEIIGKKGIEAFVKSWMELPLFQTLKTLSKEKYNEIVESKLQNNPVGLINSLKGFGTGAMPPLWDKIGGLKDVLLLTGELDKKFTGLNAKMIKTIKNSEHIVFKNCGHNIHLEKPDEFIILVTEYLKKFESKK